MITPIDPMLYFYLLAGIRLMDNSLEKPYSYNYRSHTTSYVISNQDMYDIDQIVRDTFIVKEE